MSKNLGQLTIDLVLRTGGFVQGADRAAREAQRLEGRLKGSFTSIARGFSQFTSVLAGFGVGLSAIQFVQAAKEAIEFGDSVAKMADKTGVGATALTELAHAAKLSDISLEQLGTAFKKMQVTLSEAGSGNKNANETLRALGLTIAELQRLAPDKQFELLAERINNLQDPADRVRAAVELFGRAGAELLPLFSQGAEGIRKAREEAQRLGLALSEDQIKKLADADQAIKRLDASWSGFARTVTAAVAPALTKVFDILSNADQVRTTVAEIARLEALVQSRGDIPPLYDPPEIAAARRELEELYKAQSKIIAQARVAAISRGGGSGVLAGAGAAPGFKPGAGEAGKEAEQAQKAVESFINSLEREQATLGATAAEAQRYAVLHGEIAEALKKLGPAADGLRAKLLHLIDVGEQQAATKAIEDQIKALRDEAAQVGLTEEQLFEYQLRQAAIEGQLGKTADEQARLTAEWRDAWADMRAAVDQAAIVEAVGELDRELLELMGDTTAAAVAEITERFKKLREAAEVEIARGGPRAAEAQEVLVKIKARIDLEEFRAKAEEFRREVEEIREEFGRREQTIQLRVDTGVVSDIGGRREIIAVHQEEAAALEAIIAKYPEMREEIEKLLPLIEDLKTTTDEFGKIAADAFETGLSDALADAAKGVKSLGEAAEDFLQSITDALLDWAAQQIASQMRDIIFGSLPQFGAGALGGLFKSAGGGTNLEEISVTTARLPEIGGEAGAAAAATALTTAGTTLTTGATALTTGATTLTTGATTFVTGVTSLVTAGSTLTAAGAALTAAAAALTASAATDAAGGLSEIIISTARLAEGGKVFGPGTGTSDSIPAMLSAGEFVVKAQAVQKPGVQYLLEKINDGAIFRGFAEGGYTGPPRFTVSRYADGGLVQPTAALAAGTLTVTVPPQQEERRPTIVQQSITVNAPGGNISKPTEMQITAATARGVRVADRHNN